MLLNYILYYHVIIQYKIAINYYNIAAINYLFDKSNEKNNVIIDNIIKSYKSLRQE